MYITINTGNAKTIISGFKDFSINSEIFSDQFTNLPAYENQLQQLITLIKDKTEGKEIEGIGIAHTGDIDKTGEIIEDAAHTPDYNDHNVVQDLREALSPRVIYMTNDSLATSLAEVSYGKAKDYQTVGVIYLYWGLGGAYLKRINQNSYSVFLADIGHQIIEPNGKICSCGQRGCLEAYVSAEAIKKRFLVEQSQLEDVHIWDELTDYMALGASNLFNLFFPEVLILTGETITEVPYVKDHLISKIISQCELTGKNLHVEFSDFSEKGPTYGALALLKIHDGGNTITHIE